MYCAKERGGIVEYVEPKGTNKRASQSTPIRTPSHAANLLLALVFVQRRGAQQTPPLEQHRVADQLEPGRELQPRLLEHLLQLVRGDIAGIPHLVGTRVQVDVGLDEENVVHWNSVRNAFHIA